MSQSLWQPHLVSDRPVYQAIADALEKDVASGLLTSGARLPTHRELASALRITPLTVTRAYKEAARRGLVEATVGRGTFVRTGGKARPRGFVEGPRDQSQLDLSRNIILGTGGLEIDGRAQSALRQQLRRADYEPAEGTPRHRAAAAAWIRRSRLEVPAERIVITPGAHQAMVAVLAAACAPGDIVLVEECTYPRFAPIAGLLRLELRTVELDEHGAVPASLDKMSRGAKAFYFIPNFQNPTGTVMPEKRRREIAAVAERRQMLLLEDDVYGFLLENPPLPVAAFAPERTCFLTGVSKSLSPSLRIGFAAVPAGLVESVTAAFAATTAFTSSVSAELFTQLFERGQADQVVRLKRELVSANRGAAERGLGDIHVRSHAMSPHLWIDLGPGGDAHELAERARMRGLILTPGPSFAAGRTGARQFVRVAIGAIDDAAQVENGMRLLAGLMRGARLAMSGIV